MFLYVPFRSFASSSAIGLGDIPTHSTEVVAQSCAAGSDSADVLPADATAIGSGVAASTCAVPNCVMARSAIPMNSRSDMWLGSELFGQSVLSSGFEFSIAMDQFCDCKRHRTGVLSKPR